MYTVLDFETTGLDYKENQVIEIGAIKLDKHFVQVSSINILIKLDEGCELPAFITKLTGIEEEDLSNGVASEFDALMMLRTFIGKDIVVAQFASFDLSYLSKVFTPDRFICTRTVSRLLDNNKKASLKDLVPRYGTKLDNHHRALADVEATADIFKAMMGRCFMVGFTHEHIMNVMLESPERPLNFIPDNANIVQVEVSQ